MALFQSSSPKGVSANAVFSTALKNASSAEQWLRKVQSESGQEICERAVELLQGVKLVDEAQQNVDLSRLEAVLKLNEATQPEHEVDCTQYLLQIYQPHELELRLRNRILNYAHVFLPAYAAFSGKGSQKDVAGRKEIFAKAFSRQLFYLCEIARWQMFSYFMPDERFWRQVNAITARQSYWVSKPCQCFCLPIMSMQPPCRSVPGSDDAGPVVWRQPDRASGEYGLYAVAPPVVAR